MCRSAPPMLNSLRDTGNIPDRFRVLYQGFLPGLGQTLDPTFQLQGRLTITGIKGEDEPEWPPPLQISRGLRPRLLVLGKPSLHIGGCPRVECTVPAPDYIYIPMLHKTPLTINASLFQKIGDVQEEFKKGFVTI